MISKKMKEALNTQINAEYFSAYLYHAMAAYCEDHNFKNFTNWMGIQTREKIAHGKHMYDYLLDRGGKVALKAIAAPQTEWGGFLEVFQHVYKHELEVTRSIHNLADLAIQEKDHATYAFLQWYVDEQVEEEATADQIVQQLKFIGNEVGPLFNLDKELGTRVFVPPFPENAQE